MVWYGFGVHFLGVVLTLEELDNMNMITNILDLFDT